MSSMTWDEIRVDSFTHGSPFYLNVSTSGCGCCAEGTSFKIKEEAIKVVQEHIHERMAELEKWCTWLTKMETSDVIVEP